MNTGFGHNLQTIKKKETWDELVLASDYPNLLQSWSWGELQKKKGNRVVRLKIDLGQEDWMIAQVFIQEETLGKLKLGSFGYIPYGPLFSGTLDSSGRISGELIAQGIQSVIQYFKSKDIVYLLLEPHWENVAGVDWKGLGLSQYYRSVQAKYRWILNLEATEKNLLSNMRKNTRYSIKQATKHGITTTTTLNQEENKQFLKTFYGLLEQTSHKNHFAIPPRRYFENMLGCLGDDVRFLYSHYSDEGKSSQGVLSCALIASFGASSYYLWASSRGDLANNIPAQYPVIWQAITEAKQAGQECFDFWGLKNNPLDESADKPKDSYDRFKTGFGGDFAELINPLYFGYKPIRFWLIQLIAQTRRFLTK
jgi:lipid II:glycine glycyltransferase (peptidoglycan interpeptide bridge formation enzyme)